MIRIFATVFAGVVGLAFGSFLNVCLSRWPAGESVVKPASHCRNCGRTLAWWENIPVLSWIALRGRCRTCGVGIGWRYPLVELAVGTLWAIAVWRNLGPSFEDLLHRAYPHLGCVPILLTLAFYWLLVALAFLDAENLWLPDWLTLPGIALGLLNALLEALFASRLFVMNHGLVYAMTYLVGGVIAAAGLILLIRWIYWLVRRREGIGLGDAKLMAMLAAWLGLPGALLAFAIGIILGAVVGIAVLARPKRVDAEDASGLTKLPLGTFLCIGGIVSALWGQAILTAYLRWAGFN